MCEPVTTFLASVGTSLGATGTAATVTGAAVVGGTAASLGMQYQGYQASKAAARTQQAMENLRAQRSQVQALREAQIKRAMMIQSSAGSGVMDSSGFAGGLGSLGSQLAGNQMYANQVTSLGQQFAGYQQDASRAAAFGQLASTVSGFAMSKPGVAASNKVFG